MKGSTLTGAGQAVVVRQGTVSITDSTLGITGNYADGNIADSAAFETAFGTPAEVLPFTSSKLDGSDALKSVLYGQSVQYWRNYGIWGNGNEVVRAALVIGNSDDTDYQLATNVTISGLTFTGVTENVPSIAIAAHYAAATMGTAAAPNTLVTVDADIDVSGCLINNAIAAIVKLA